MAKKERLEPKLKIDDEIWVDTGEDDEIWVDTGEIEAHIRSFGSDRLKGNHKKANPTSKTLEECKICGATVATTALTCPHCGDTFRGGLQGLENIVEARHPVFYKLLSVFSWAYLILEITGFIIAVYFIAKFLP